MPAIPLSRPTGRARSILERHARRAGGCAVSLAIIFRGARSSPGRSRCRPTWSWFPGWRPNWRRRLPGIAWKARAISDVKLRAFIAPDDTLELEAKLIALSADAAIVAVETRRNSAWRAARACCSSRWSDHDPHRRVAITGVGMVTPVGNDAPTTWRSLVEGRSGVLPRSPASTPAGFPTRIGAEIKDFTDHPVHDPRILKFATRANRFALAAAEEALTDAGIRPEPGTAQDWGCAVGAGMMGASFSELEAVHAFCVREGEFQPEGLLVNPLFPADPVAFCRSQTNAGVALLTRHFGIGGYATAVHTACASGGQALGTALKVMRRGLTRFMLAGGYDSMLNPIGLSGFCLLGALSTDNHDTPGAGQPPFRRHPQRLRPGRRRRLPGARGLGKRVPSRRADLRRTGGRRQFAEQLSHHRFPSVRRRTDPGHAPGARQRRAQCRTRSITSMRTALRRS
jgi:hypothetical protein